MKTFQTIVQVNGKQFKQTKQYQSEYWARSQTIENAKAAFGGNPVIVSCKEIVKKQNIMDFLNGFRK